MSDGVRLTYAFRTGALTGIAGPRRIQLLAHVTPDRVAAWEKQQEIRSGRWTPSDHTFAVPGQPVSPGRALCLLPAAPSRSAFSCTAAKRGPALFVDDGMGGCFIHGWPPCSCARCIVVPHGIEDLVSAAATGGTLTIV
jgi:hypothetical protein